MASSEDHIQHPKSDFIPLLGGVTSFLTPREREGYLTPSTTEPDQYFLFHSNFNCNGRGTSLPPDGIFIWSLGRQRVGGGRDPRDPGLCVSQPILHTLCVGEDVATYPQPAWQLWVGFEWFHCFLSRSLCSAAGLLQKRCKVLPAPSCECRRTLELNTVQDVGTVWCAARHCAFSFFFVIFCGCTNPQQPSCTALQEGKWWQAICRGV